MTRIVENFSESDNSEYLLAICMPDKSFAPLMSTEYCGESTFRPKR